MGTVRSLVLGWVFIRALFLARCSLSLCKRLYPGSFAQAVHGSCCMRRPDDQCWTHGGTAGKGEDLEDRDEEKGPTCEHGENKDNGVWY